MPNTFNISTDLKVSGNTLIAGNLTASTITAGTFYDGSVDLTDAIYHVQSTGAEVFTGLTRNSSTTFSVAPVEGYVAINAGAGNDLIPISYSGASNITTPYINTSISTYVLVNSASTLVLQSTYPTPQERREKIFLGRIAHPDKVSIVTANNTTDFIFSPMSALRDMFTPIPLINENIGVTYSATTLGIKTTGGNLWGMGINFPTNPLDPDRVIYAGATPATFQYRTQTGGTYGNTTLIEPGYYDNGGVRTAIVGTKSTNQRVYLFPAGQIRVQYGQTQYNTLTDAVSGLLSEPFITFENNRLNAILIGVISVVSTATDLSDSLQAFFHSVSKFGEVLGGTGGLATTTLQQAYQNSSDPSITTNSTNGALEIRGGTGSNTDNNLVIQNNSGTNTGYWTAGGSLVSTSVSATTYFNLPSASFTGGTVTGPTIFTNGLTANTISGTTYRNLPFSGTVGGSGTTNYLPRWTGTTALGNSQIRDDGTNIGVGTAPNASYKVSIYSTTNIPLFVQNQSPNSYSIYGYANGAYSQTGIYGIAWGSTDSTGVFGIGLDGNTAIGVKGSVDVSEFGTVVTGIGGYFDGRGPGSNGYPLTSYSVQLIDGTEGTNKVLISTTSDGKANWSDTLTGLTNVRATTISATTYQGNVVTQITAGSGISVNQSTGNVTITATGGAGSTNYGAIYTTANNFNFI